jgi:hypothetical protein
MSGEYRRIGTAKLWQGARMRALRKKSRNGHDLLLYLLTCPQGNYAGIFVLSIALAAEDLRWSKAKVLRERDLLVADGHIHFDPDSSVVYLPQVLEWDPAGQEKQFEGIVRRLKSLPDTSLVAIFKTDLVDRGLVEYGERARPLLDYFGLTRMRQQSHHDQTATQSQFTSQVHSQSQAQAHTVSGAEGNSPLLSVRGNGNGRTDTTPLTSTERFWEDVIVPLTHELHRREEWLEVLRGPGALEVAKSAVDEVRVAQGRGGVHNPGALLWSRFRELRSK